MTENSSTWVANVRDFGAIGDGKADDTAAIDQAWAFAVTMHKPQYLPPKEGTRRYETVTPILYFPPGVYRYTGKGLDSTSDAASQVWHVRGDGANSARIEIESDVYLITCGRVESTIIEGLSFTGGKGVFKSVHTEGMVGGKHIFRDCYFQNYTQCAIGNNANDSPYLTVYDCVFACRPGAQAIGIAWGGYLDDSQIERCCFERNAYHLKIGERLSGSFQIGPRNLFLSFRGTTTQADIWIVPNTLPQAGINSGQGAVITDNKFGNENLGSHQPRILVASEDMASGADRLTRMPGDDVSETQGYLTGVRLRGNFFSGRQGQMRGIVYSRVPHTALVFDHNYLCGGPYPYLIEFDPRITRLPDRIPGISAYVYPQERDGVEAEMFPTRVCNLPGYAVVMDSDFRFAGEGEALSPWRGADPAYVPLLALPGSQMPAVGQVTLTPAPDAQGNPTAALVQLDEPAGRLDVRLDASQRLQEGRIAFLDIELMAAPAHSLDDVQLMVLNEARTDKIAAPAFLGDPVLLSQRVFYRTIQLQPYWQRLTIPFVLRDTRAGEFHLVLGSTNHLTNGTDKGPFPTRWAQGTSDSFVLGNVRVYHAKAPDDGARPGIRTVADQDLTLRPGVDPQQVIFAGALSAPRTVDFDMTNASLRPLVGDKFRITRQADGAAALTIKGITTLAAHEWCEVVFTGTQFTLVAQGKW